MQVVVLLVEVIDSNYAMVNSRFEGCEYFLSMLCLRRDLKVAVFDDFKLAREPPHHEEILGIIPNRTCHHRPFIDEFLDQ